MKIPEPKKLPSGNWNIRMRLGGQNISITKSNKKDCVRAAELIKAEYRNKARVERYDALSITLSEAYTKYIDSKRVTLSPSTVAGYESLQRSTFAALMDKSLKVINNDLVQTEVNAMVTAGKSPKRVSNAVGLLSAVLKRSYPAFRLDITQPQKTKPTPRQLRVDELQAIISAVKDTEIELPVLMALWMGMRMSEIRGVRVEDMQGDKLHICRAIVQGSGGQAAVKPPKTFSGDRYVNIPAYIKTLVARCGVHSGYIVTLTGQAIYKRFTRMCEAHGIAHCRFHDLRHANAAAMIALGIDGRTAQERNGWKSEYMYKQVYGYVQTQKLTEADTKIDAYFADLLSKNADENADKNL